MPVFVTANEVLLIEPEIAACTAKVPVFVTAIVVLEKATVPVQAACTAKVPVLVTAKEVFPIVPMDAEPAPRATVPVQAAWTAKVPSFVTA